MAPRADDTPRRGAQPRRGTSRDLPADEAGETGENDRGRGFGGIGDARAYTPRGRTVAERDQRTRSPRAGRTSDPFRPPLQVLDGGQPQPQPRGRGRAADGDEAESRSPRREQRDPRRETPRSRRPEPESGRPEGGRPEGGRPESGRPESGRPGRGRGERGSGDTDGSGYGDAAGYGAGYEDGDGYEEGDGAGYEDGRDYDVRPAGRTKGAGRGRDLGRDTGRDTGRERAARERARDKGRGRNAPTERGRTADRRVTAGTGRLRVTSSPRTANLPRSASARIASGAGSPRTARNSGRNAAGPARPVRSVRAVTTEPPKLANSGRRLRLGTVLALSLFVTIGVRLVVLQVASSPDDAAQLVKIRASRTTEVVLPAARGSILDRNGAVLAHSIEARFIAADPQLVKDPAATAAKLSPLLAVSKSKLLALMMPHKRAGGFWSRFEYLAQGVDISIGDQIEAMKIAGIRVERDSRRDEPGADLAANLIGFTGADHSGLEGLEAKYDSLLRGTDGMHQFEIGKGGLDTPIPGGYEHYDAAQPGTSLELTIDSDVQFEVQRILSEQMQKVNATLGGAIVIDVKTGEVLAQASYPSYNAAKPEDYTPTDREDVPSGIIADPGSVHKAFIFGAALEEGIITPSSVQVVGPAIERGGYRFQDSHVQPKGTKMTIPGMLAYSSNVGTILTADKLGKQKVYEYQQKFGLGKATDEGMPGEAPGRILTPDEWSPSASGSVPIGMSVDATLVQMAAGYAAIANDGTYIQPHLIKELISGTNGKVTAADPPATHQVLRPEVAAELRTMMEAVVDNDHATGKLAAVAGYRVAGKTGTGKRLIDGKYTSYNYGSFIGMAPAENPRFVIAVSADVPTGTGGDVAAPAFSKMMSFALLHYRVPPSSTKAPELKIYP